MPRAHVSTVGQSYSGDGRINAGVCPKNEKQFCADAFA